ncbi:hypothetical protein A9264_12915 [Vibrio sp. UCD-FRSSP16_10]|uniref:hypothetical protein n=1 Tax=unclassified Vibrio TaxID=2614977 RepID=UPI0007FDDC81|nr:MULTISPECIES: hypothetical protein [unclassified Vibrio]OBT15562.1 hypothetical protein A9260_13130 [Vibrio sp. UCD-FRSSP16_30]OBT20635.1 hypothetical protein A9264_12915 [Vibrio sp. UCD-FRSSP16_10]
MSTHKQDFLDYLQVEFDKYSAIPTTETQLKFEKKQYINGLMMAARIFGVEFDELEGVLAQPQAKAAEQRLDIPAYIRQDVQIQPL